MGTDQFGVFQDEQRVGSSLVTCSVRQQGLVASVYKNAPIMPDLACGGSRKFMLVVSWMPLLLCKASPRLARGAHVGADLLKTLAAIAAAHRPDSSLGALRTRARNHHVPREVFAI